MRRFYCIAAVATLVICAALPVLAGQHLSIIEGADPVGSQSHLTIRVQNASPEIGVGMIEATVILADGRPATQTSTITVAGGGQQLVTLDFAQAIRDVISVGIIEGPDPIPQ